MRGPDEGFAQEFLGVVRRHDDERITRGQHVVIWSENRPEWIVALWGCLLRGVVLVPIDYRASADFLRRVAAIVSARAVLTTYAGELTCHVAGAWPTSG